MRIPEFTAQRSLGGTETAYRAASLIPAAVLTPAFLNPCSVDCYQVCSGDPSCLSLCLNYQRFCPPDPCLAQCSGLTGKQYALCLRFCNENRCYSDCVASSGRFAPPQNVCAGSNDPYCTYNCACICLGPPGCTPM